jgi:hypothetical protein
VYLIQNKKNITCMVTESYEEWGLQIQKLKERDSLLFGSDQISESDKDPAEEKEE